MASTGKDTKATEATVPQVRVSSPLDKPADSPYTDPATGKVIPMQEGDWRRTRSAPQCASTHDSQEANTLNPNRLDFSIERKESRLPEDGEVQD
ncbi:hypothetical protein CSUI_001248 [Cystoisospora suis]|uniref:Uncharacterized protein n=1 Tax=Cystoisospora suis TaxID=483139 RepID=A0A2C6LDP7_9APIC|nr:hypothetical protein CSUI_001248 [Cystoisospora suis]